MYETLGLLKFPLTLWSCEWLNLLEPMLLHQCLRQRRSNWHKTLSLLISHCKVWTRLGTLKTRDILSEDVDRTIFLEEFEEETSIQSKHEIRHQSWLENNNLFSCKYQKSKKTTTEQTYYTDKLASATLPNEPNKKLASYRLLGKLQNPGLGKWKASAVIHGEVRNTQMTIC